MAQKIAFSALTLLLFVLVSEGALRLAGVAPESVGLSRGFDSSAGYIVPDPRVEGGFQTRVFDGVRPERVIPPRGKNYRVLLFGGSNTEGFPHGTLQRGLREAAREARFFVPGFEVINLGRRGYGSERVTILFEQAMQLEPDVVVIYSGHNEFVEESFRIDLEQSWSGADAALAEYASHLAAYQALAGLFEPPAPPADPLQRPPEEWVWEYHKFSDYSYAQTLQHLEHYRSNLERILDLAAQNGVGVVLCTVLGNHLAAPWTYTHEESVAPDVAQRVDDLLAGVDARLPPYAQTLVPREARERLLVKQWASAVRQRVEGRQAPFARRLGGPLAERANYWPDPAAWDTEVLPFLEAHARFHLRQLTGDERAELEELRGVLGEALGHVSDHPGAHFRLGLVLYLLGEDETAVEHLDLAARYDRAPRRGNDVTNEIVRELAAQHPEVQFVDVDLLYRDRAPSGLIGFELMKDECHPHDAVLEVLMQDLAPHVLALCQEQSKR